MPLGWLAAGVLSDDTSANLSLKQHTTAHCSEPTVHYPAALMVVGQCQDTLPFAGPSATVFLFFWGGLAES